MFQFIKEWWQYPEKRRLLDRLELKKRERLADAMHAAHTAHPEDSPAPLICSISFGLLHDPIITPQGHVYERTIILKALESKLQDPVTRTPLTPELLVSFTELKLAIGIFRTRQERYRQTKETLITAAREAAHHIIANSPVPNIFICPIKKQIIVKACITPDGQVFDQDSLTSYLESHQHQTPEGKPLKIADCREFPAFNTQIRLFHEYVQSAQKAPANPQQAATSTSSNQSVFSWLFRH